MPKPKETALVMAMLVCEVAVFLLIAGALRPL